LADDRGAPRLAVTVVVSSVDPQPTGRKLIFYLASVDHLTAAVQELTRQRKTL
jgi:hypothetical protein